MKTERRHDLKHNALDSELGKIVEFFRVHGNRLFWGVMIGATVVLVVIFAKNRIRQRHARAYQQFQQLQVQVEAHPIERIDGWIAFAQDTHNRRLAGLALVAAGDENLRLFLLTDGSDRQTYLARGEELYRRTLTEYSDQPMAAAMAHFGLATVAMNREEFDLARREYKALLEIGEVAGTPISAEAQRMSDQLPWLALPVAFESRPATTPIDILEGLRLDSEQPGEAPPDEYFLPGQFP